MRKINLSIEALRDTSDKIAVPCIIARIIVRWFISMNNNAKYAHWHIAVLRNEKWHWYLRLEDMQDIDLTDASAIIFSWD